MRYSYGRSNPVLFPNEFAVHQTHDPWGLTHLRSNITADGYSYSLFTPADLAARTYASYRVTVLNWDDTTISDFASPYGAALHDLEYYVQSGGVLWLQTAVNSAGGTTYPLPFSGTATYAGNSTNTIIDPFSQMVTGMPNPFTGDPASTMTFTGLPAPAHIVVRAPIAAGLPTLYEYAPPPLAAPCPPLPGTTSTPTATSTSTATATPTSTACAIRFADVAPDSTFYSFVRCLACRGIVSGYACGGPGEPCNITSDPYFRPGDAVTRGQVAKVISQAAGFSEPVSGQSFQDIAPGSPFYAYIERLASRSVMSGYACGNPEPCVAPANLPYFRPGDSATRGQLSKIVSNAAGFLEPVSGQSFQDIAPGSPFYAYVERLASRSVMSGYACGNPEPCVAPGNLPYFRANNRVTRGQTTKVVTNAFALDCPLAFRE